MRSVPKERPWWAGAKAGLLMAFLAIGALSVVWQPRPTRGEKVRVELAVAGDMNPAFLWRAAGLRGGVEERADPVAIRDLLMRLAVVESVELQRLAGKGGPVRLVVQVRRPVANLVCPALNLELPGSETALVLDGACVAIPVFHYSGSLDLSALPNVHLLKIPDFAMGKPLEAPAVRTAVAAILGAAESGWAKGVSEVRQTNDYSIVVDFNDGPAVQFAFDDLGGQMQKLRQLQSYAERVNRKLKTVNLVLRRNIPVTFEEETLAPRPESGVQP